MTMVVLGKTRRALLARQVSDVANLAIAALVFGQFIGSRQLSVLPMVFGFGLWLILVAMAIGVAGKDQQ